MKNYNDGFKLSKMLRNRTCDNMSIRVMHDDEKNITLMMQEIDSELSVAVAGFSGDDGITIRSRLIPSFIVDEDKVDAVRRYANWSNLIVKRGWLVIDDSTREVYMDSFIPGSAEDDLSKDTLMKEIFLLPRIFLSKIPDLVSINDGNEFDYDKGKKEIEEKGRKNGAEKSIEKSVSEEMYIPNPDVKDQMFG